MEHVFPLLQPAPREQRLIRHSMASVSSVVLSPGDQYKLNSGKKRKVKFVAWKDKFRKKSRDSGEPYISKRKKAVPGKLPPSEVSGTTFLSPPVAHAYGWIFVKIMFIILSNVFVEISDLGPREP